MVKVKTAKKSKDKGQMTESQKGQKSKAKSQKPQKVKKVKDSTYQSKDPEFPRWENIWFPSWQSSKI